MTTTTPAPRTRTYATLADVSGAKLRECDRVLRDGRPGAWHECVVGVERVQVLLGMKSGKVVRAITGLPRG